MGRLGERARMVYQLYVHNDFDHHRQYPSMPYIYSKFLRLVYAWARDAK